MNNKRKIILVAGLILLVPSLFGFFFFKNKKITKTINEKTQVIEYKQSFVPNQSKEGSCWTGSNVASSNKTAFRCTVGHYIYDPCFETESKKVVCSVTPDDNSKSFELKLTEPLPNNELRAGPDSGLANWIVDLDNGTRCTKFSGTAGSLLSDSSDSAQEMYFYTCSDETVLVGYPDMNSPLWQVKVTKIDRDKTVFRYLSIIRAWQ